MGASTKQTERGQELLKGSGHGRQREAGKHSLQNSNCRQHRLLNKATAGNSASGFSARHRPQETNGPQLADFAANNSHKAVLVGGQSAGMLALRKAGSDLPNLSPPHLSPLPVTVPTHSLNL